MNLTRNHWIRFTGIAAVSAFVSATICKAPPWHLPGFFVAGLAGALVGHWLAVVLNKGKGN